MEIVKPEVAAALLTDLEGREVPLASLWAERPAVVVWLRHFG